MRWLFISSGGVLVRDILIASGSGVILGIIFYFLAVYQVSVRAQFTEKEVVKKIKNAKWVVVWIAILTTLYIIISFSNIDIRHSLHSRPQQIDGGMLLVKCSSCQQTSLLISLIL